MSARQSYATPISVTLPLQYQQQLLVFSCLQDNGTTDGNELLALFGAINVLCVVPV